MKYFSIAFAAIFERLSDTLRQTNAAVMALAVVVLACASGLALKPLDRGEAVADTQFTNRQIKERVAALLAKMTLDEKIGQLNLVSQGEPVPEQLADVKSGRIGNMMNVVDPAIIAQYKQAAEESRHKIPLLFGLDAVDVFRIGMPPPIAWAATWRPELAEAAAREVALEAAERGINWTFAPMIDISRDPRWGRVVEGAGEDAYLGAAMAAARVRGYRAGGLIPTLKHYVGYGAGEAGRDYNSALIPTSDLYDRYLPPFQAGIDAGADTVMAALNAINGVPATSNRFLLDTVLRGSLGFTGFVSSDYNAIGELMHHGVAGDLATASRIALKAGTDLDMEGYGYVKHLRAEYEAGRVTMAEIDAAVTRVLTVKFKAGLGDKKPAAEPLDEARTRSVARQVAREGTILLKNANGTLPLNGSVRTIAVIGEAARYDGDESWYGPAQLTKPHTPSLLEALTAKLRGDQTILFAPAFTDNCGKTLLEPAAAEDAALRADIVLYMVSEDCEFSGEGASRTNLDLSIAQSQMFDRLAATGKPIVLIVTAGRPLTIARQESRADAILYAWLPRTEGRVALAEILVGDVSPSGKLPMTMPRSVGQIPISYNVLPTSRPPNDNRFTSRYLDEAVTPLFAFGHGLSYTTFEFTNLRPLATRLSRTGKVAVEVDVTNTGSRTGEEVAQLYIRRPVASRSRPLRELKGFEKIKLRPGETRTVRFMLSAEALGFHDDGGHLVYETGPVELFAGSSSQATLTARLQLE